MACGSWQDCIGARGDRCERRAALRRTAPGPLQVRTGRSPCPTELGGSWQHREKKLKQNAPLEKKMRKGAEWVAELGWMGGSCRGWVRAVRLKGSGQLGTI